MMDPEEYAKFVLEASNEDKESIKELIPNIDSLKEKLEKSRIKSSQARNYLQMSKGSVEAFRAYIKKQNKRESKPLPDELAQELSRLCDEYKDSDKLKKVIGYALWKADLEKDSGRQGSRERGEFAGRPQFERRRY